MNMAPRKGTRRACDPCSVRKVRCDGNLPCSRCEMAIWDCTYLKTHGKSGPKGPRRTTEAAIRRMQERNKSSRDHSRSNSETSFDATSPSPTEHPYLNGPPMTGSVDVVAKSWSDPPNPTVPWYPQQTQKFPIACISQYLGVYRDRGYGIWPVVDAEALITHLATHGDDVEAYALATAICAAVVSQFSVTARPGSPNEDFYHVSSSAFECETRKAREEADHMENVSLFSILGSFFLHVYSANVGRMNASTSFLGEAIFKAHIIGLHKASYYLHMSPEQMQHSLRIYWLLFITERAHSIQHDVPTTLKRASELPHLQDFHDGTVTPAFVHLCKLFHILDITITADPATARNALTAAQQQLSTDDSPLSLENELQRADISMTQQWMRIFLWQHALNVTSISSTNASEEFSFSFPAKVAKNVLSNLSTLSQESIEAHGPGMESKLFDVVNSLADVMIIMPSMNQQSHFGIGPRDLIHNLSRVLADFRGGNQAVISVLQEKLSTLGIAVASPQRVIEFSSPEEEHGEWHGRSLSAPSSYRPFVADLAPTSPMYPSSISFDAKY